MQNWYKILGVSEQATNAQLKAAYRKLAKENHPDSYPGDGEREKKFKESGEAYRILSDSVKRKAFDTELHRGSKSGQDTGRAGKNQSGQNRKDIDFQNIHQSFESFFGFNPVSKEVVNEDKLKTKAGSDNPLDVSDLFHKFMGIKR